ncbi:uncharacterized protein LOC111270144 [Varroa jacobsoni]|uniref:Uncharacterized protein n=1 Tax=Varroa destructor TaxID=109461 RepID=A0A7M7K9P3_VARDE|nr:uncharacterized protein LOC111251407 [Varroa destructor]XP_022705945.1 uncharacterized protein LOC111270144 [Varroa jacobsoni]XP_022705947.1 uncharacterized protein LOC111270144 [Varroa jacobsoni]
MKFFKKSQTSSEASKVSKGPKVDTRPPSRRPSANRSNKIVESDISEVTSTQSLDTSKPWGLKLSKLKPKWKFFKKRSEPSSTEETIPPLETVTPLSNVQNRPSQSAASSPSPPIPVKRGCQWLSHFFMLIIGFLLGICMYTVFARYDMMNRLHQIYLIQKDKQLWPL